MTKYSPKFDLPIRNLNLTGSPNLSLSMLTASETCTVNNQKRAVTIHNVKPKNLVYRIKD